MNILDKFLGFEADGDLTDTPWWTDTIFRGLEREAAGEAFSDAPASGDMNPLQLTTTGPSAP
jgi:hypothetical protein